jgi:hypothetical protein
MGWMDRHDLCFVHSFQAVCTSMKSTHNRPTYFQCVCFVPPPHPPFSLSYLSLSVHVCTMIGCPMTMLSPCFSVLPQYSSCISVHTIPTLICIASLTVSPVVIYLTYLESLKWIQLLYMYNIRMSISIFSPILWVHMTVIYLIVLCRSENLV